MHIKLYVTSKMPGYMKERWLGIQMLHLKPIIIDLRSGDVE